MAHVRTNVVLDKELVERAMETYGFDSIREAVDYALRRLLTRDEPTEIFELEGIGWEGELNDPPVRP